MTYSSSTSRDLLNMFCVLFNFFEAIYHSKSLDEHAQCSKLVLEALRKEWLFAKLKNHTLYMDKVVFLDFIVCIIEIEKHVGEEKVFHD